jgi:lysyl endopeptidase
MGAHTLRRVCAALLATVASTFTAATLAAVPVHIVKTDLKPGIRAGILSPVQFAVLVPHSVSTSSAGTWSTAGGQATWQYAVEIPTAVSMSFHATKSSLPESAVLVVRGAKTTVSYRARDLHRADLWSRIQPGEALQFTLTVAASDRDKVALNIVSLQAGYRSLGSGVKDHPYYRQLKAQLDQETGNAACVTNYECEVTTANTPPGQATVALVIGNLYQCSGSLINDVPGDNTPYVLTARHCETGKLGGGNPGAASTAVVYWDATTPCGGTLGSIYDGNIPTQTGAQTIVEQQDAWLIELDDTPVVSDAQLAGFDASGSAAQGGYTVHHAEGYDKQFTAWFGQAYPVQESGVLGSSYLSNFWETVNQTGNIGPGASGSGLFDQNNHLVGALTLGRTTSDPSGYGACPVTPLAAPNGSNGVADFTSLAAVWNSTADTTSSTGSNTLKSVLDPENTGTVVVSSLPAAVIQFAPFTNYQFAVGDTAVLSWTAANATQCTASGGVAGDGWSGTVSASGSQSVTEAAAAAVTYILTCTFSGGRVAHASTTLTWVLNPQLQFNVPLGPVWTTRPAVLSWASNVGPCSISGGDLSLTNLPESGTTTTTQATPGDATYNLTCGPTNNGETLGGLVTFVTPSLTFGANGTDRLLGQTFFLQWLTYADSCTPSGGAPNDGWAVTAFPQNDAVVQFSPKVTAAGTYTYTLTCSSGPISLQQNVTVTFEDKAPYVTASLNTSSVTFSDSPVDYVTMTYNSNLSTCSASSIPNLPSPPSSDAPFGTQPLPQGSLTLAPYQSGTYQLSVTCIPAALNPSVTSTPLTLTVLPPPPPVPNISFSPSTIVAGETFSASWSSSDSGGCDLTGGIPGGGSWGPGTVVPVQGSYKESGAAGNYTFGLTCSSIDPNSPAVSTKTTLTIGPLTATLASNTVSLTTGNPFTLTWSSVGATACMASGGGADGSSWSGALATSGTVTQTASVPGTFTYTLVCSAGSASTTPENVTIKVSAPSSSSGSGGAGGGHGGGGGIGWLELGSLAALLALGRTGWLRVRPGPVTAIGPHPANSSRGLRA